MCGNSPQGSADNSLCRQYCRDDPCREACPDLCGQLLSHAACQSRACARQLAAQAARQADIISKSRNVCQLLSSTADLEAELSGALRSELNLIRKLCTEMDSLSSYQILRFDRN